MSEKTLEEVVEDFVKVIAASLDRFVEGGKRARILIALSGGPDSTALLLAMHDVSQFSKNLSVEAAHVNHRLRGEDSDQDEIFCRELCACLQIPLRVFHDDQAFSNSEDALRERRYAFLKTETASGSFDAVATAHTINDQAETLLFRLIRGTSLKGLGGIKESRPFSSNVVLLRPMLSLRRADVLAFLKAKEVSAREDLSNSQLKYSRNFIRQIVLKPIDERFPGASERIAAFSYRASADNDFIERQAEAVFEQLSLSGDDWDLDELRYLHQSLLTRIFALGLKHREIEIDSTRIETLQTMLYVGDDYRTSLDGVWDVSVDRNHIRWLNKEDDEAASALPDFEIGIKIPGLTLVPNADKKLLVEEFNGDWNEARRNFPTAEALEALVDLSEIQKESVLLRRRRAGDFIRPLGMEQNVRLKKYLHTRKASHRAVNLDSNLESGYQILQCIVLASGQEILWVPGIGLSERLKVKPNAKPTHRLAILRMTEDTV